MAPQSPSSQPTTSAATVSTPAAAARPPHTDDPTATQDTVAGEFRYFAARRAGSYAPLYARLGEAIADDAALLDVAAHARAGQSRPDLLLAVIHDLLLRQPDHPATRFYPSITASPADGDPVPAVLEFAHARLDQLADEVSTRLVQTNEVARCTFLAPAVRAAAERAAGPVALLEVGASAGLNLLLDRYGYRYRRCGRVLAELPGEPTLDCTLDGTGIPPHGPALNVVWRAGIDLNPLDVDDPVDRRWLRALIWPDHRARAARLEAALQVATTHTPRPVVHAGNATELLPQMIAAAPESAHLIVYHSAVLAHMPAADRARFEAAVLACAAQRPLSWVQAEPRPDRDPRRLRLTEYREGRMIADHALGAYHPHGQHLRWEHGDPFS